MPPHHNPLRVSLIGVGEVILEYAYTGLRKLEEEGKIKITSIADINSSEATLANLQSRHEKRSKERKAIENLSERLTNKNIGHYQTSGDHFDPETAKDFFNQTDIIYLATPNNVRVGLVEQVVAAEKGIVLEKPVAHTVGKVNRTVGLASKVKGICAEHYAYKAPSLRFFETFEEKTRNFGSIISVEGILEEDDFLEAERYKWLLDPKTSGGGIWLDTGGHMMFLLHKTGARVRKVKEAISYKYQFSGELESRNNSIQSETAADVYLDLRGDNGNIDHNAFGHIRVAKCKSKSLKFFRVNFEKGEVFLDYIRNSIAYIGRNNGRTEIDEEVIPKQDPYYNMMSCFTEYLNGGPKPPTTFDIMKPSTDSIFRIYEYMKEGDARRFY